MGGIISKPKAPSPLPSLQPQGPSEAEKRAEADALKAESEKAKAEELARARRGLNSTIKTSYRGVLEASDLSPKRKTLLGE